MKKKNRIILGALTAVELQSIYQAMLSYDKLLKEAIAKAEIEGLPCTIRSTERRILKGVTRKIQACLQDQCHEENSD